MRKTLQMLHHAPHMTCAPMQRMHVSLAAQLAEVLAALLGYTGWPRFQLVAASQARGANSDRFANAHSRSHAKLQRRNRYIHVTRGS